MTPVDTLVIVAAVTIVVFGALVNGAIAFDLLTGRYKRYANPDDEGDDNGE